MSVLHRMARVGSSAMVCRQQSAVPRIGRTCLSEGCFGEIDGGRFSSQAAFKDMPVRFSNVLKRASVPLDLPNIARRRHSSLFAVDADLGGPSKESRKPENVTWRKDLANSVNLIGNIGRDVEIKYLDNNRVFAKTSIAVNRGGNKADTPSWFELEFWDSLAEIAQDHLKKGAWVHVQGRVFVEGWVDAQECKRTTAKVVVAEFNFVSSDFTSPNQLSSAAVPQGLTQPNGAPPPSPPPLSKDRLWQEYFSDPSQWWDNRNKKLNPKAPDFKHKSTNEALWIDSYTTPAWVKDQLAKKDSGKGEKQGSGDHVHIETEKPEKPKANTESSGWGDF